MLLASGACATAVAATLAKGPHAGPRPPGSRAAGPAVEYEWKAGETPDFQAYMGSAVHDDLQVVPRGSRALYLGRRTRSWMKDGPLPEWMVRSRRFNARAVALWSPATLGSLLRAPGFDEVASKRVRRAPFLWKSLVMRASRPTGDPEAAMAAGALP